MYKAKENSMFEKSILTNWANKLNLLQIQNVCMYIYMILSIHISLNKPGMSTYLILTAQYEYLAYNS